MSEAPTEAALPALKSLRAKGWLVTLALLAYVAGAALYISDQRSNVLHTVQQLEQLALHEKALALAEASLNAALVDASEASSAAVADPPPPSELRLYMENCSRLMGALSPFDASYGPLHQGIEHSYAALLDQPVRANWIDMRESLARVTAELESRHRRLTEQRDALTAGYHRQYDAVTVESLLLAAAGLLVFGTVAAWFFVRLAGDVRRLEAHARHIVHGGRGVVLDVNRDDELGQLMRAVNRLATDLDEREKQIELDNQRHAHQDKMLAVGALAAGIAHEVNNPLAVIAGVAQALKSQAGDDLAGPLATGAQTILVQAQRASQVARHLAEAAAPQPSELDWVDVNALLRRVVQLMGYDRRYRTFGFELQADAQLPAVRSSAHAIQQVLMQILSMGCDAMVVAAQTPAWVQLATAPKAEGIEVSLRFPPVLDFSRSDVQRSLLLCRAIVEPLGARLAFGQVEGPYLRITLTLPSDRGDEQG